MLGGERHQLVHTLAARCGEEVLRDVDAMLHGVGVGDVGALGDDSLEESLASIDEREEGELLILMQGNARARTWDKREVVTPTSFNLT